jgi:chemotaxis protein histidine kinase CheA
MTPRRAALLERFRVRSLERIVALRTAAKGDVHPEDPAWAELMGDLHTLKGESRMLGLADLSELARMFDVRWGRNRYAGHPADSETAALLVRISDRTEEFRRGLDGTLERFRLTDTRHQEEITRKLSQFIEATSRLRERFDAQRAKSGDVKPVLQRAQPVDRLVRRWQLDGRTERTWNAVRSDLERLAEIYGLSLRWEV